MICIAILWILQDFYAIYRCIEVDLTNITSENRIQYEKVALMQHRPVIGAIWARQYLQSPYEVKDYKNQIAKANDEVQAWKRAIWARRNLWSPCEAKDYRTQIAEANDAVWAWKRAIWARRYLQSPCEAKDCRNLITKANDEV